MTGIAFTLWERVDLGADRLFGLISVGLSNFREPRRPSSDIGLFRDTENRSAATATTGLS